MSYFVYYIQKESSLYLLLGLHGDRKKRKKFYTTPSKNKHKKKIIVDKNGIVSLFVRRAHQLNVVLEFTWIATWTDIIKAVVV